jgi:hypothetical protein
VLLVDFGGSTAGSSARTLDNVAITGAAISGGNAYGGGAFGNETLYVGARSGGSLFFTGKLRRIAICGPNATAAAKLRAVRYYATDVGAVAA